ncbi:MAG: DUF1573 domain-containing protein [Anaerolineae bacterium]
MANILVGVTLAGLAVGLVFFYGRSQTAERTEPLGIETASLPPLSTQGKSIRGWHDMANIPENYKGRPLPKDQPQPDVAVKPADRYLGAVGRKDVVNLNYIVVNTGNQDLVIDNVVTSCGCTTAMLSHSVIPPGHRADLGVRFDVGYHPVKPGEQVVRVVWLMTNDPDTPVAEARLTALVQ